MATAAADYPLALNGEANHDMGDSTTTVSAQQTPSPTAVHPQAVDIIRQIDHYFSDDSLSQDAHLLGLIKAGNGTVSLNEVLGFKKMRQYRPKSTVKEAVKLSEVVEVVKVGAKDRLRRREALKKSITVVPKVSHDRQKVVVPEDKPWLTKAMMKPTGFEEFASPGPIRPEEYEEDRREYDPDNSFVERIENAVRKFNNRRKMHTETRLIFEKYMIYGGMDAATNQFTGGIDNRTKDEMTKKEIQEMTARYAVSERVLDGFFEDGVGEDGEKPTYVVDFEASAKGFLSSVFQAICNWYDEKQIKTATMVLRNFYNYLLLHDVCPEYSSQLRAALKVCEQAEEELLKLAIVDKQLPGGFSNACSTLFEGNYQQLNTASGDWVKAGDDIGWTKEQAKTVFLTGIFAYGTDEQLDKIEQINASGEDLTNAIKVINKEESMGVEIVAIEPANKAARQIYDDVRINGTLIKMMGKLRCKRWPVPHGKREDLPKSVTQARKKEAEFEFLLEDETLQHCFVGMKMEVCVKELSIGVKFIDCYESGYVSFFTWLWNERVREWKEPGPPTGWMERHNAIRRGDVVGDADAHRGDDAGEDDTPDRSKGALT